MQKGGTVYLLVEEGDNEMYKIGVTRGSVENRIKKLQTGNGNKIRCIFSFDSIAPYKLEGVLHDYYKLDREEGEWFLLGKEQVEEFLPLCEQYETVFKALKDNPFF